MNIRYEIDDNDGFAIRAWNEDNPNSENAPFLLQPTWPNNTPWGSRQEAETWAQHFVEMMNDFRSGRPGEKPDTPFHPWTDEDEERYQKQLNGTEDSE